MNQADGARWRGAATAVLLLVTGALMGILVDRYWLAPPPMHAAPLTAEAMAARLRLSPAETERVRRLLDSLHTEILGVVPQGPDSLAKAARDAQKRIEAVLPPDARAEFRAWMQQHHDQLMSRMHGDHTNRAARHSVDSTPRQR